MEPAVILGLIAGGFVALVVVLGFLLYFVPVGLWLFVLASTRRLATVKYLSRR